MVLIFSSFGAGKTFFLEMLPSMLREWLQNDEQKCLLALQNAMCSQQKLSASDEELEEEVAQKLLQALHSLAGTHTNRSYHFFLLLR